MGTDKSCAPLPLSLSSLYVCNSVSHPLILLFVGFFFFLLNFLVLVSDFGSFYIF